MQKSDTFIEITNQDIFNMLKDIKDEIKETKSHVKETNGKVADAHLKIAEMNEKIENKADKDKSFGTWVSNHPLKFAGSIVTILFIVIQETRSMAIRFIASLFI